MIEQVLFAMMDYFHGDAKRINHFMKVFGFAKTIGAGEMLDKKTQKILEIAAATHDIGIVNSEVKHGSAAGIYQQIEGPPEAEKLLRALGVDDEILERVCWLIARHHTYENITGLDYQILVEADFLVNAYEDNLSKQGIDAFHQKVFKTKTGEAILQTLYGEKQH